MEAGSLIIQKVPYDNECTQTGSAAALHLHSPHGGNTVTTVKKQSLVTFLQLIATGFLLQEEIMNVLDSLWWLLCGKTSHTRGN